MVNRDVAKSINWLSAMRDPASSSVSRRIPLSIAPFRRRSITGRWRNGLLVLAGLLQVLISHGLQAHAQPKEHHPSLDAQVTQFLESHRHRWNAWNVPFEDGKILHDLVVAGRFRNILEIGTSTGHSAIWLAWAASKTGGKVVTIEIDPGRHKIALENFKQAGVEAYIDARLADAHDLVTQLPGPFDFVFSDADKEWL